jgi:apolipoprotein N-acyltransferase
MKPAKGRLISPRFIALYGGALLWALAYPPLPFGLLIFVALIPMFWATRDLTLKQAFGHHFAAGILFNTLMYWWIYNVIAVGPGLVIGGGLVLLILFLSLFNGFLGWVFRIALESRLGLFLFPFFWAGLEVLRAYGQMSFPWNNLGYALGHHLTLIQNVRLIGVYGLSAMLVGINVLGYIALTQHGRRRRLALISMSAGVALLALDGSFTLRPRPGAQEAPTLDIALVQPSIPQTKKWEEGYFIEVVQKTFNTMDRSPTKLDGVDLVVLPETAIPDFLRTRREVIKGFKERSTELKAPIILGALDYLTDRKPWREYQFFNSAYLFRPGQDTLLQYNKVRLVPFSEKLPFDNIFPVINYVNLGEGDFSEGKEHILWGGDLAYAPSICYEVIYPSYMRNARRAGAKLFVNVTNDGWFGRSNAPYQHANIARFRVIETGAPMARSANTGISVFYDYQGRNLGQTRLLESTVLRRQLPLTEKPTLYLAYGDVVEGFFLLIFTMATGGLVLGYGMGYAKTAIRKRALRG